MTRLYPTMMDHLTLVLGGVAVLLITTERTPLARLGAALAVAGSGLLGVATLDLRPGGVIDVGGMLMPLFTGLFGAPILLDALRGEGFPAQADAAVTMPPRTVGSVAVLGTLSGAVVGYLPGISSAIAATGALVAIPRSGPRAFLIATSGVNTSNAIFALFALVALGTPRTGVLVALDSAGVPVAVPLLLSAVAIGAAAGFVLVLVLGDRYLAVVGRVDHTRLVVGVLAVLVGLVAVFAGPLGLAVFGTAALVGLIPARLGARRATLMGVLLIPIAL